MKVGRVERSLLIACPSRPFTVEVHSSLFLSSDSATGWQVKSRYWKGWKCVQRGCKKGIESSN